MDRLLTLEPVTRNAQTLKRSELPVLQDNTKPTFQDHYESPVSSSKTSPVQRPKQTLGLRVSGGFRVTLRKPSKKARELRFAPPREKARPPAEIKGWSP